MRVARHYRHRPPVLPLWGSKSGTEREVVLFLVYRQFLQCFFFTDNYAYTYKKLERCPIRERRKINIVNLQLLRRLR
jgi:hypothetical protein